MKVSALLRRQSALVGGIPGSAITDPFIRILTSPVLAQVGDQLDGTPGTFQSVNAGDLDPIVVNVLLRDGTPIGDETDLPLTLTPGTDDEIVYTLTSTADLGVPNAILRAIVSAPLVAHVPADTDAPVVTDAAFNDTTKAWTGELNEAGTQFWASHDTDETVDSTFVDLIIVGSGTGIYEAGNFPVGPGGGPYPITLTDPTTPAGSRAITFVVRDVWGNVSDPVTFTFTMADEVAPTATGSTPADNATSVSVSANLVRVFSETIQKGSGNVLIRGNNGGFATEQTIPIGDASITLSTTNVTNDTMTINPPLDLVASREYSVQMASGVLLDAAGNPYAGIADDTTWSFTTAAAGYIANAVEFTANADAIHTTSGLAMTAGTEMLFAMTFMIPTAWPGAGARLVQALNSAGSARFEVQSVGTNSLSFTVKNASAVNIFSFSGANNSFLPDVYYDVELHYNAATGAYELYKSTDGVTFTAVTPTGTPTAIAGTMENCTRLRVNTGSGAGTPNGINLYLADLFIDMEQGLDLTISGNRDKLSRKASKGAQGATPTGVRPHIFLSGDASTFLTNKGDAGTIAVFAGTSISNAPVQPT